MNKPIQVTEADFDAQVLQSPVPVLVDVYADWCGPCRAVAPVVEQLAEELAGRLKVVKLDADANLNLTQKYGVFSIPTLIVFQGGREVDRFVGALPKPALVQKLQPHLAAAQAA